MIKYTTGDILKADAEALVNTVNCYGVMGRGIALQFKKKFPENFKRYKKVCDAGELKPGVVFVCDLGEMFNPRYVINFPTKDHWKGRSKIQDIESGLVALVDEVRKRQIRSIAVPPLGCGLGGLRWSDVRPRIAAAFCKVPQVEVLVFEPGAAPSAQQMVKSEKAPAMTKGRAAMIGLMRKYRAAAMDPVISLLEVHKLMYFLVATGEPMDKLQYEKGPYGPYSTNLHHVLNETEGYFTLGFADGGENPEKPLQLMEGAIEQAEAALESEPATLKRFVHVAKLIEGFETPFGMELLATVHWVATREDATTPKDASNRIAAWSDRKRDLFSPRHINLAWMTLAENGLLRSAGSNGTADLVASSV